MIDRREPDARAFVTDWWQRAAADASEGERRRLLEDALGAVWRRARGTLGDITLAAIMERVLSDVADRSDVLRDLTLDDDGRLRRLPGDDTDAPAETEQALLVVLAELLSVIGRLTADILTPALRAEVLALPVDGDAHAHANANADELEPTSDGKERGTSK